MQSRKFLYFFIALGISFLVWFSFQTGFFVGLEYFFEDLLFTPKPFHLNLVIIAIDDESLQRIGQWPWPREVFMRAFQKMDENEPLAVGVDVIFAEPSRIGILDDEALWQQLLKVRYPVILPVEAIGLELRRDAASYAVDFLKPLDVFVAGNNQISLGHANIISDRDSIVRKLPLSIKTQDALQNYLAFGYEVVSRTNFPIPNEETLKPIERIVYAGAPGSILHIPFWRLLEDDSVSPRLKGKIVLMGVTASDLHDDQPTPVSRGKAMSGVEIQANIVNMFLQGYRLQNLSPLILLIWILGASLISALIFIFSRGSLFPLLFNLGMGVVYLIVIVILFQYGIIANVIHINASWMLATLFLFSYKYFIGEKERNELKRLFSKYVSKDVLEEILQHPEKVVLGGEVRELTIFFSDIRGFTALSERTNPQELVRILNRYFTIMTEEILRNGGVLDKYIGDAIMAFWGAPIEDPNQAENALRAGLGMVRKLQMFNKELKARGGPQINLGIGIYTGQAVVGNVGSENRFDYTVIGDTVNMASRLEGVTKDYKVRMVIAETTKQKIKETYPFISLGSVLVKGRKEKISIYTLDDPDIKYSEEDFRVSVETKLIEEEKIY